MDNTFSPLHISSAATPDHYAKRRRTPGRELTREERREDRRRGTGAKTFSRTEAAGKAKATPPVAHPRRPPSSASSVRSTRSAGRKRTPVPPPIPEEGEDDDAEESAAQAGLLLRGVLDLGSRREVPFTSPDPSASSRLDPAPELLRPVKPRGRSISTSVDPPSSRSVDRRPSFSVAKRIPSKAAPASPDAATNAPAVPADAAEPSKKRGPEHPRRQLPIIQPTSSLAADAPSTRDSAEALGRKGRGGGKSARTLFLPPSSAVAERKGSVEEAGEPAEDEAEVVSEALRQGGEGVVAEAEEVEEEELEAAVDLAAEEDEAQEEQVVDEEEVEDQVVEEEEEDEGQQEQPIRTDARAHKRRPTPRTTVEPERDAPKPKPASRGRDSKRSKEDPVARASKSEAKSSKRKRGVEEDEVEKKRKPVGRKKGKQAGDATGKKADQIRFRVERLADVDTALPLTKRRRRKRKSLDEGDSDADSDEAGEGGGAAGEFARLRQKARQQLTAPDVAWTAVRECLSSLLTDARSRNDSTRASKTDERLVAEIVSATRTSLLEISDLGNVHQVLATQASRLKKRTKGLREEVVRVQKRRREVAVEMEEAEDGWRMGKREREGMRELNRWVGKVERAREEWMEQDASAQEGEGTFDPATLESLLLSLGAQCSAASASVPGR